MCDHSRVAETSVWFCHQFVISCGVMRMFDAGNSLDTKKSEINHWPLEQFTKMISVSTSTGLKLQYMYALLLTSGRPPPEWMRIAAHVSLWWGLGMDARTRAAGYNFTIKIEVQLLEPGVGNGAISATIKICKKRSILHLKSSRDIFGTKWQFCLNFLLDWMSLSMGTFYRLFCPHKICC